MVSDTRTHLLFHVFATPENDRDADLLRG